ncbi:hypothetical protein EDC32_10225 [Laceyella sacchari]|nr:hypothetical protein [Laceyella sacchari]TCW38789.1 hypothetical protein EDC32_10225 [Laceyella sacchari]
MAKTTDDMYTWTFTDDEAVVINFALDQIIVMNGTSNSANA